jgi:hypothetical protein
MLSAIFTDLRVGIESQAGVTDRVLIVAEAAVRVGVDLESMNGTF